MDYNRLSQRLITAAIFIAAVFVPIFIKMRAVSIPMPFQLIGYPALALDGFAWYKSLALIASATVALIGLALHRPVKSRTDWVFLALAGLALLSSVFSPFHDLNLLGVPNLFEGVFTGVAFFAMAIAGSRVSPRFAHSVLPFGLAVTMVIVTAIGLGEISGRQLLNIPWINHLLLQGPLGSIAMYEAGFGAASAPFGNPNYAGLFAALLWPFFVGRAVVSKTIRGTTFFSIIGGAALIELLASGSRGGLIGASIALGVGAIIVGVRIRPRWNLVLILVITQALAYSILNIVTPGRAAERVATLPVEFRAPSFQAPSPLLEAAPKADYTIKRIQVKTGRLRVEGTGPKGVWGLFVERQLRSIKFMDLSFRPLLFQVGPGEKITLLDSHYAGLELALHDAGVFRVLTLNHMDVAITNWGFRIGRLGSFVTPVAAERFPLPFSDQAFDMRGFIWSYSIPLLKHTLLLGRGPGAFPFEFPNNDPIVMSSSFGLESIVDKPHNFYISFAYTYGVVALLLLLGVYSYYVVRVVNRVAYGGTHEVAILMPYVLGFIGFVITAISVDSTVGVSSPFWVMLGIGLSLVSNKRKVATDRIQASSDDLQNSSIF
ncbi:MAG: O-antigen ligase family protein [Chitinophagaceae bacterium]|nr:O-antigen ligase family protein [Oligoflexus sp.]